MKRLLRGVQLLEGPGVPLQRTSALLEGQSLLAWGEAAEAGVDGATQCSDAPPAALLAPVLVDPHSHLLDPFSGRADTLESLAAEAAAAGYGTVALLAEASEWRDRPEALQLRWSEPLQLLLWGAISSAGSGSHLAPLADLHQAGAVGFCDGESIPPLALLERVLLLGDADDLPLLVAPRDPSLAQSGLVREGVDTLRLGWPPEPLASEVMPLQSLLALASRAPQLRLLNLSTAQAVEQLRQHPAQPKASVCWWHLLQDHSTLDPWPLAGRSPRCWAQPAIGLPCAPACATGWCRRSRSTTARSIGKSRCCRWISAGLVWLGISRCCRRCGRRWWLVMAGSPASCGKP